MSCTAPPIRCSSIENARALYDGAAATDKTWSEFPDGDHCIYNHSHDKHTRIADWFADRLVTTTEQDASAR